MSTPAPFVLQTATWRDLPALRSLEHACFGQDAWPLPDLLAALTVPGIVRVKAVVDGKMVAFAAGDPRDASTGWITTIGVLDAYRRMGIATALLDACEQGMRRDSIRLCVRRSNAGAIRLYLGRGYRQVSVWPGYYIDGEDALVLEKRMDEA